MIRILLAGLFACAGIQLHSQEIRVGSPLKMLALGDSYTIGESVEVEKRWPHQLAARLREMGVTAHTPQYIAQTGWTTGNLLAGIESRYDEDQDYNLVSILIGVNNQYRGLPISSYEPELLQIVEFALEVVDGDTSRVFMLSIPDYAFTPFGGGSNTVSGEIDQYNVINKAVASLYGIRYIDVTPVSREGLEMPELVAADGLHPSGQQYALWVDLILPYVTIEGGISGMMEMTPNDLMVSPNPSSSLVRIDTELQLEKIIIYHTSGMTVYEQEKRERPVQLDLSRLSRGFYLLEARGMGQSFVRPIVLF